MAVKNPQQQQQDLANIAQFLGMEWEQRRGRSPTSPWFSISDRDFSFQRGKMEDLYKDNGLPEYSTKSFKEEKKRVPVLRERESATRFFIKLPEPLPSSLPKLFVRLLKKGHRTTQSLHVACRFQFACAVRTLTPVTVRWVSYVLSRCATDIYYLWDGITWLQGWRRIGSL